MIMLFLKRIVEFEASAAELIVIYAQFYSIQIYYNTSLFSFKQGPAQKPLQNPNPDEDPLPNEDHSENNSNDGQSHNDLVTINVTNEIGQTKQNISNG